MSQKEPAMSEFKVGDSFTLKAEKVVVDTNKVLRVTRVMGRWIWGSDGYSYTAKCIIKATPEEIAAGHRIDIRKVSD